MWCNITIPSSCRRIAAILLVAWKSSGLDGQALCMQKSITKCELPSTKIFQLTWKLSSLLMPYNRALNLAQFTVLCTLLNHKAYATISLASGPHNNTPPVAALDAAPPSNYNTQLAALYSASVRGRCVWGICNKISQCSKCGMASVLLVQVLNKPPKPSQVSTMGYHH